MARFSSKYFLPLLPIVSLLIIWFIMTEFGFVAPYLLPTPGSVYQSLLSLSASGALLEHSVASLTRVSLSFSLAVFLSIPIGLTLGWYSDLGRAFKPLIELFRTISPISWIPLAILWFGIGNEPAIFILFMSAFFPMIIATKNAVSQVDPILIRVAENLGASGRNILSQVVLPASISYIFIGARISLGISWLVVVAAEMAGLRSGLGYLILDGRNLLQTEMVIAGMIVIGLIGLLLDWLMVLLERGLRRRGYMVDK